MISAISGWACSCRCQAYLGDGAPASACELAEISYNNNRTVVPRAIPARMPGTFSVRQGDQLTERLARHQPEGQSCFLDGVSGALPRTVNNPMRWPPDEAYRSRITDRKSVASSVISRLDMAGHCARDLEEHSLIHIRQDHRRVQRLAERYASPLPCRQDRQREHAVGQMSEEFPTTRLTGAMRVVNRRRGESGTYASSKSMPSGCGVLVTTSAG